MIGVAITAYSAGCMNQACFSAWEKAIFQYDSTQMWNGKHNPGWIVRGGHTKDDAPTGATVEASGTSNSEGEFE